MANLGNRRRRHKNPVKDYNASGQQSDPEQRIDVNSDHESNESRGGWGSLDEALLQIAGGNSSSAVEEAEVSRRLSSLNVSDGQCRLSDHMYSKLPSGTLLECLPGDTPSDQLRKRHCRKRSCKRNRKRTKKARSADSAATSGFAGKQKRVSHLIDKPRVCSHTPTSPLSSENQATGQNHRGDSSETSSRAVTDESESPDNADVCQLIDDAGGSAMDSEECGSKNLSASQSYSESELTESLSDSGCDGDDEESSVEVFTTMKMNSWWETDSVILSSCDEMLEEDSKFQQILDCSFPLMTQESQLAMSKQIQESGFKHPQQLGIRTQKKKRKKVPPFPCSTITPHELSKTIRDFVQFSGETELQLPVLNRALCRIASSLAQVHRLEYCVNKKRRLPVASPMLRKTTFTCLASWSVVEAILRNHRRELTSPLLWSNTHQCSSYRHSSGVPVTPEPMVVVGVDAPPISESNIGNQMLRNMGWQPGYGLGPKEDGVHDPLVVHVRHRFTGLGYSQ